MLVGEGRIPSKKHMVLRADRIAPFQKSTSNGTLCVSQSASAAELHLAQAPHAHLGPGRNNDDRSDYHDADDREVDGARLQVREKLRNRERHGHVREFAVALGDSRAAEAVLHRERMVSSIWRRTRSAR